MRVSRIERAGRVVGRRTRRCRGTALLFVFVAQVAMAQDPVAVAPGQYKVEFEDQDVRVLRVVYAPGEKSAMRDSSWSWSS